MVQAVLLLHGQTGQRDRVELGLAGVAARGQHAGDFRSHDHGGQFAAAEVRHRLEEDVGRFEVGEEQAVGIARDGLAFDLLVFRNVLVERHVE